MCKGQKKCTELGIEPIFWDKKSPLPPPSWFKNEINLFSEAVRLATIGDIDNSLKLLLKIKSNNLRIWYCDHGQVSGRFRNRILKIPKSGNLSSGLDPLRSPDKYSEEVFKRDNFTCQYCSGKVIPKEVLNIYSKIIGEEFFRATGTNLERHGIILAFRANADHVTPWKYGGVTNAENLVTCCWSCNYGKAGYSLKEIMVDNPKRNNFNNSGWSGLTEYLSDLKRVYRSKK